MGRRDYVQRSNRVRLKADCTVLLDRIVAFAHSPHAPKLPDRMMVEIAEMRMRLAPPPGVKAPIVLTGYTRDQRKVPECVLGRHNVEKGKRCPWCNEVQQ